MSTYNNWFVIHLPRGERSAGVRAGRARATPGQGRPGPPGRGPGWGRWWPGPPGAPGGPTRPPGSTPEYHRALHLVRSCYGYVDCVKYVLINRLNFWFKDALYWRCGLGTVQENYCIGRTWKLKSWQNNPDTLPQSIQSSSTWTLKQIHYNKI